MSTPSFLARLVLTALVAACRPGDQREPSGQTTIQRPDTGASSLNAPRVTVSIACSTDTAQGVTVTPHCFGPMPADSSLGFLATTFPSYQIDTAHLETTPVLVWYYNVRGATAMLSQQSSTMDLTAPAFEWRIQGQGILLPGGVPLPRTWADLRHHFSGAAYVTGGELGSQVEICELKGLRIDLGMGEDLSGPPDSVPPNTIIGQVVIYPTRRDSDCH